MAGIGDILGSAGIGGAIGKAIVSLELDTKKYMAEMNGAKAQTTASANSMSTGMKSMSAIGTSAYLAIGAAAVSFGAYAVGAAMEAEKAMAQTEARLKSTGGVANVTAADVLGLSESLRDLSGIDDEVVQGAENMLLTFTKVRNEVGEGNNIFDQATESIADMATGMNQGAIPSAEQMQSASIQLGKALNDPIKGMAALARVGVQFSAAQEKQITTLVKQNDLLGAQKIILAEVQTQFGGAAEAAGNTFAGRLAILQSKMQDLAQTVGEALLPALEAMVDVASDLATIVGFVLAPSFEKLNVALKEATINVAEFAAKGADWIVNFATGIPVIGDMIQAWESFRAVGDARQAQEGLERLSASIVNANPGFLNLRENAVGLAMDFLNMGPPIHRAWADIAHFGDMAPKALEEFRAALQESVQVTIGDFKHLGDAFQMTPKELANQAHAAVRIAHQMHADLKEIMGSDDLNQAQKEALAGLPAEQRHAWAEGGKKVRQQIAQDAVETKRLNDQKLGGIVDSATTKAMSGGKAIGQNMASGIVQGLESGHGIISDTVAAIVRDAIAAGNKAAGSESPSKVMKLLGLNMMQGLHDGISEGAQKAIDIARKVIEKMVADISSDLDKVKSKAQEFANTIKGAFAGFLDFGGLFSSAVDEYASAQDQYASAQEKYAEDQEQYAEDQKKYLQDQARFLTEQANYQLALTKRSGDMPWPTAPTAPTAPTGPGAAPTAPGGAPDLSSIISAQVSAATEMARVLKDLQAAGAGKALLAEVAETGVEFGKALLLGGKDQIAEANKALADIAKMANLTGKGLSEEFFGKKIDRLENKLERLHDDLKDLTAVEKMGHNHDIVLNGEKLGQAVEQQLNQILDRRGSLFQGATKK